MSAKTKPESSSTAPSTSPPSSSSSSQYAFNYTTQVSQVLVLPKPKGVGDLVGRLDRLKDVTKEEFLPNHLPTSSSSYNPAHVASTFLQCMLIRSKSRPLGQKMLAQTLHSACKTGGGGGGAQDAIRVFTVKQLQVLGADPNTIKSLVHGTGPHTQYALPELRIPAGTQPTSASTSTSTEIEATSTAAAAFNIAKVTQASSPSSSATGFSFNRPDPNASPTCDVHFVCTGVLPTHSPTRFVRLELEKNGSGWRVRDFADLMKPVVAPAKEDSAAEAAEAAKAAAAAKAELDAYKPMPRFTGGGGLNKPLFGGGLTRWRRKARESNAERNLRHQVAKADTKGLARKLSAVELNKKFAADPKARVVVDCSNGMIKKRTLKKGELFDKAVGFECELHTIADMELEAEQARAAAEIKRREQFERRVQSAIATSG